MVTVFEIIYKVRNFDVDELLAEGIDATRDFAKSYF